MEEKEMTNHQHKGSKLEKTHLHKNVFVNTAP